MAAVADFIVSKLKDVGVRAIFGVPGGGGNLDLIEAAGRAGLPFILTTTETGGAIAAIAQSEVTGEPSACLTTLGPGAASVVNGIACAYLERAPIFVFTDNHAVDETATHQALPNQALFQRITSHSVSLGREGAYPAIMKVFSRIGETPRGPVHVDYSAGVGPVDPMAFATTRLKPQPLTSEMAAILRDLIRGSRRPLLLVGLAARRPEDAAAIRAFCTTHHVPALVTYKAKGVVADDDPWFGGVFTHAVIENPIVDESDLLIGVGLDPVELLPRPWRRTQPIMYVGPAIHFSGQVPFAVTSIDDVPNAMAQLASWMGAPTWEESRVRDLVADQRRAIDIPAEGLTAQQVVTVVAAACASTCRVTVDAGAHMFPATMLWPVSEPNGMLISNGLSTMGFALPAAIGAALIDRPRQVVALTGDGGLLMCLGELLTAVRERLRIIVVVFNDASLSLIEIKQQARALAPAGVALGAVDWRALAAGFGVPAFSATDERSLARAVEQAMDVDGPCLIDAKIDRSNYGATLRAVRG